MNIIKRKTKIISPSHDIDTEINFLKRNVKGKSAINFLIHGEDNIISIYLEDEKSEGESAEIEFDDREIITWSKDERLIHNLKWFGRYFQYKNMIIYEE